MLYVYVGCLTFGVVYSVLSLFLGGHGADHSGFDHAGFDHAGVDGHHVGHDSDSPSIFSPLVIASSITVFGAVGMIGKLGFGMGGLLSSLFALVMSGITGALIFFGIVKLMYSSQSNSTFSLSELTGTKAKVITPIPVKGTGELAYVINGVRYNIPAKSLHGEDISRGEDVIIIEVVNNTAMVARRLGIDALDEDLGESDRALEKNKKNK